MPVATMSLATAGFWLLAVPWLVLGLSRDSLDDLAVNRAAEMPVDSASAAGDQMTVDGEPEDALPELLQTADGRAVRDVRMWEEVRRGEILELFERWVYGRSPDAPDSLEVADIEIEEAALDGAATRKHLRIAATLDEKTFAFEAWVLIPNQRPESGQVPAMLLINNRGVRQADPMRRNRSGFWPVEEIIERGYATAVFQTRSVDPDRPGHEARQAGVRGVFSGPGDPESDGWATLAAWAWGAQRVMDYMEKEPAIDAKRVGVIGHSRGGKAALLAGALDQRFALVVSNNSGCGGAALSRRRVGETVREINRRFPHWFAANFKRFNDREEDLPVDQHQLLALIAPRGLYVGSAREDHWADPQGEFLGLAHASPAWRLYGLSTLDPEQMPPVDEPVIEGRTGYHIRSGGHNLTAWDWTRYLDFADRLWEKPAKPPQKPQE
ncbi:MAG: acetylxylan esterase [Phycisphaeraceae bacterium]|nr:acetylxylan esterase [Phycisphaeraceae bacterium]